MKRAWFAALALVALCAAAPRRDVPAIGADQAGNRLIAFAAPARRGARDATPDPLARHCTADRTASRRWCAQLRQGGAGGAWDVELVHGAGPARHYPIAAPADEFTSLSIWPYMVTERSGAVMIAVVRTKDERYPTTEGGVANTIMLRAEPAPAPLHEVMDLPSWAYIGVHACPHRGDSARRFGACWDEAEYRSTIRLDPATRSGMPHFIFEALARTRPAHGVLEREMTREAPLRRSDIRWATDPECSYRFRYAYQPALGRYMTDGQFPRCPDYFGF